MPELIAVLSSRHGLEKIAARQLLGDGRSALWEDSRAIGLVSPPHLGKAPQQISDPELVQHAGEYGVVDSAMREEVLVLRGQDRVPNHGRDVVVPGDLAVFRGHLNQRPAVDVVDVADGRKLKPAECFHVGQVGSIETDVIDRPSNQRGRNDARAKQHAHRATPPAQSAQAAAADSPGRRQGPRPHASQPGSPEHGQGASLAQDTLRNDGELSRHAHSRLHRAAGGSWLVGIPASAR